MNTRVLEKGKYEVTNGYSENHEAIDIVGGGYTLDNIIAHTAGRVIFCQDGLGNIKGSMGNTSYGNCVKIDHENGYATLYAHMLRGLKVKNGDYVEKGQVLGYMSDSGNAYGGHLHFEVWKDGVRINPTEYLDKDLVATPSPEPTPKPSKTGYSIGDVVEINGIYVSSDSDNRLIPAITKGTITRIVDGAKNPYLLDDGNIGWINESCIVNKKEETANFLCNPSYNGVSIVDALNQIGVNSSYDYRSKLASANGITNYTGTAEQNLKMVEMLKNGTLKSI